MKKGDLVRYTGSWDDSKFTHGIIVSDPFDLDFKVISKQRLGKEFIDVKWWMKDGRIRTQTDSIDNLVICNGE